jgi:DNA-directed RNA polymerase III subunit RPC7
VKHFFAVRKRIHDGSFYTVLNDGHKNGLKRKANDAAPTEDSLFNPFMDNQTFSSQYMKKRRKLPVLDDRPYAVQFFPQELHATLGIGQNGLSITKKKRTLGADKTLRMDSFKDTLNALTEQLEEAQARAEEEDEDEDEDEEAEDEEKEDADEDDDNWSAVSSDSEDSDDDYNAEQYFENGEEDDVEDDTYDNAYDL